MALISSLVAVNSLLAWSARGAVVGRFA